MILIIIAIGLFGAAAYLLLSGLTVRQRQVAVALGKAKRYVFRPSVRWRPGGASTTASSAR